MLCLKFPKKFLASFFSPGSQPLAILFPHLLPPTSPDSSPTFCSRLATAPASFLHPPQTLPRGLCTLLVMLVLLNLTGLPQAFSATEGNQQSVGAAARSHPASPPSQPTPPKPEPSRRLFLSALRRGQLSGVRRFLRRGGNPNFRFRLAHEQDLKTPLQWTIEQADYPVFLALLQNAQKLNFRCALSWAIHANESVFLEQLLEAGARPQSLAVLTESIRLNKPDFFKLLADSAQSVELIPDLNNPHLKEPREGSGDGAGFDVSVFETALLETMADDPLSWGAWFQAYPGWMMGLLEQADFWIPFHALPDPTEIQSLFESLFFYLKQDPTLTPSAQARRHLTLELVLLGNRDWLQTLIGVEGFEQVMESFKTERAERKREALEREFARTFALFHPLPDHLHLVPLQAAAVATSPPLGLPPTRNCCSICWEPVPRNERLHATPACGSACLMCQGCLFWQLQLQSQFPDDAQCPVCKIRIHPHSLLTEMERKGFDPRLVQQTQAALFLRLKRMQQACRETACDQPECSGVMQSQHAPTRRCNQCGESQMICEKGCQQAHPQNISCHQWLRIERSAARNLELLQQAACQATAVIRPCPHCGTMSEKSEGCNSMRCHRCGQNWHWVFGKISDVPEGVSLHGGEEMPMQYQALPPLPPA